MTEGRDHEAEWHAHEQARRELVREHGQPEPYDRHAALTLARLEVTSERDLLAYAYRDEAAFEAYAQVNRDLHGHTVHGPYQGPGGETVGLIDLRPALARAGRR